MFAGADLKGEEFGIHYAEHQLAGLRRLSNRIPVADDHAARSRYKASYNGTGERQATAFVG